MDGKGNDDLFKKQQKIYESIGARLRALRIKKGYASFEGFAIEPDIDRSNYGKLERGRDMRISSLVKVLDLLGVTLEEFFSEGFSDL